MKVKIEQLKPNEVIVKYVATGQVVKKCAALTTAYTYCACNGLEIVSERLKL